jgi:hypothetical protein
MAEADSGRTLDHILSRARSLEASRSSVRLPLPVLCDHSRPSDKVSLEDTRRAKELFARLKVKFNPENAKKFTQVNDVSSLILPNRILTYTAQFDQHYEDGITQWIRDTHNESSSTVERFLSARLDAVCDRRSRRSSGNELSLLDLDDSELNLLVREPEAQFFSTQIQGTEGTFAERLERSVRLDTRVFTTEIRFRLADAFLAISCFENTRREFGDGREADFGNELLSRSQNIAAVRFLETQAYRYIVNEVNKNLRKADRGGRIGFIDTICGYLTLELRRRTAWAILYYALRCGAIEAARGYVRDGSSDFDQDIIESLDIYSTDMSLSPGLEGSLKRYLRDEAIRNERDEFKIASLAVLVRSQEVPELKIVSSFEDWLWLRLRLGTPLASIFAELKQDDFKDRLLWGEILLVCAHCSEAAD